MKSRNINTDAVESRNAAGSNRKHVATTCGNMMKKFEEYEHIEESEGHKKFYEMDASHRKLNASILNSNVLQ